MVKRPFSNRARSAALLASFAGALLSCSSGGTGLALTTVEPTQISARGGATLTLHGSGFTADTEVRLGDQPVTALKIVSPGECTFTAPPLFAGPVDVKVSAADGHSAELVDGVEVLRLDLRFVEAPPYALPSAPDGGAPDGGAPGTAGTVTGAALADFDGDGHPDLITCAAGETCRFLANDGQGNFTDVPDRFPAATPDTRALAAADLDGDGLPDLVIGNSTGGGTPFRVYFSAGKGSPIQFTAAAAGTVPAADWLVSAIALADFDGDGRIDVLLATTSAEDGIALRFLRNEVGGFYEVEAGLPTHLPGTIRALAAGDVSGDGAADLVVSGDGQDRLFLNDGTGHFFDATVASMPLDDSKGTSIALVDLDRDRHPDLLIGNDGAQTRLYLNDGTGVFSDHTPLLPIVADPTVWVGIADVNGDSANDLLVINAAPVLPHLYLSVEPVPNDTP